MGPSHTTSGNVKWCSHCENSLVVSHKIKHKITYDRAIQLLGIYPKDLKAKTQRDICMPVFTATLFTIPVETRKVKVKLLSRVRILHMYK